MTIFGLLMMIAGIGLLFVPANSIGVINFGLQFLGMTLGISGSVIFVGGFLQDNLIKIHEALTSPGQITNHGQKTNPVAATNTTGPTDGYTLASLYAEGNFMTTEEVIERIASGQLTGKAINGMWFVEN